MNLWINVQKEIVLNEYYNSCNPIANLIAINLLLIKFLTLSQSHLINELMINESIWNTRKFKLEKIDFDYE